MPRLTRKQKDDFNRGRLARERDELYDMALAEGFKRGKDEAEKELKDKLKMVNVRADALRAMAQMLDAAAHMSGYLSGKEWQ